MTDDSTRSEEVMEGYKREKLATSALREIQRLLQDFEQSRAEDRRFAVIGIILLLGLIAAAAVFLTGGETITLS